MHDVTRGGLLETLLEMANLAGLGMCIYQDNIPIYPIVDRFAKAFQFEPLQMISSGTLLAAINPQASRLSKSLFTSIKYPLRISANLCAVKVSICCMRAESPISKNYNQMRTNWLACGKFLPYDD